MKSIVCALIVALTAAPLAASDCHALYRHRVVQQVVAVPYVAPVYYAVGQQLQLEALVEKAVEKKLKTLQSQAPQIQEKPATLLAAKCARCHSGDAPKGGVTLDGKQPVDDATFRAVVKMLGTGEGVPKGMAKVIEDLKPAEKGQLTEELLGLEAVIDAPPTPGWRLPGSQDDDEASTGELE